MIGRQEGEDSDLLRPPWDMIDTWVNMAYLLTLLPGMAVIIPSSGLLQGAKQTVDAHANTLRLSHPYVDVAPIWALTLGISTASYLIAILINSESRADPEACRF